MVNINLNIYINRNLETFREQNNNVPGLSLPMTLINSQATIHSITHGIMDVSFAQANITVIFIKCGCEI